MSRGRRLAGGAKIRRAPGRTANAMGVAPSGSPSPWTGSGRALSTRMPPRGEVAHPRLASWPAPGHRQEVPDHVKAAHAGEDDEVEQPVGRIGGRGDREAQPVVRAIADGHGRGRRPQSPAVNQQPHRGATAPQRLPAMAQRAPCSVPFAELRRPEARGIKAHAGGLEEYGRIAWRIASLILVVAAGCQARPTSSSRDRAGRDQRPARRMAPGGCRQPRAMLFHEPSGTIPSVAEAADQRRRRGSHGPIAAGHHHVTLRGRGSHRQRARIVAFGQHAQVNLQAASPQRVQHGRRLGPLDRRPRCDRLAAGCRIDQQQDRAAGRSHRYGEPVGIGLRLMPSQT